MAVEADRGRFDVAGKEPGELLGLLDKDFLREILEDFTTATGLTANIISTDGRSIFSRADAQKNCEFCRLVRELERKRGVNRCVESYRRAGALAAKYGEPNIFRCPAGLVEWVAPITCDGIHIGSLVCGQVLMWEPEDFFWIELEQLNSGITDDMRPLVEAARKLQVVSPSKAQAASRLLLVVANAIMSSVVDEVKSKNEVEYQKELLERERDMRRRLEERLNTNSMTYLHDQVQALSKFVKSDDIDGARQVFTVALADVIGAPGTFAEAYANVFDLVFSVSHLAIDCGANPDESMRVNMECCNAARYASSRESLGKVAQTAFDQQLAAIEANTRPRRRTVDAMRGFMKANAYNAFTLQDVADAVDLSPYYASRIFKEDQGTSIMEYATRLKMAEACFLLTNPKSRVNEVAAQLGYADSSYFTRVFKKHLGMSPREYRLSH